MSATIERAVFFEGQILGAADLTTVAEYDRNQQARHERYLHLWGIANGLTLAPAKKKDVNNKDYVEVTLKAGVGIDGWGREIVVPEDVVLSEQLFDDLNVAIPDPSGEARYPVFLLGRDQAAAQPAMANRACDSSQPTRTIDGYEYTFGRPGEELDLDKQTIAHVADRLEELSEEKPWRVLLGFVRWGGGLTDATKRINRFIGIEDASKEGISPRYAGVQADTIAARAGKLLLRTRTDDESEKPAVVLDEIDGGQLRFGQINSQGDVTPVFTVNAKGDLTVAGKITSSFTPGTVQIQSGVATDGILLPLPPGITTEMVSSGKVALHALMTPRIPATPPVNSTATFAVPLECSLDENRRIRCTVRWITLNTVGPALAVDDRAAECDYLVIASVPATTGS